MWETTDPFDNLHKTDYDLKTRKTTNYFISADNVAAYRSNPSNNSLKENVVENYQDQWGRVIERRAYHNKVYSENAETGEKGYKSVKQVFVNDAYTLLHITVKDTVIKTTFPHPFYVVGKGWVEAKDLVVGDVLKLANGETTAVESLEVEKLENPVKVYNFEVEDWHTYYVSEYGVLVHNSCKIDLSNINLSKWHQGSFDNSEQSFLNHYMKHKDEVGALSPEQYMNKAFEFSKRLKGARTADISGETDNVTRYYKNGRYIDMASDGRIISFGAQ